MERKIHKTEAARNKKEERKTERERETQINRIGENRKKGSRNVTRITRHSTARNKWQIHEKRGKTGKRYS